MDPQFEELARVVADSVRQEIDPSFVAIDKRFDEIDKRFDEFEGRLTSHIDKQLAGAVKELKHQAQLHKEELKDEVKKAAEGYDATLKKIERELVDLNENVDTGFRDRDLVLKDHTGRIIKLEERR